MNQKIKQVFRPTITDRQMLGVVEVLQHYRTLYGLNSDALEILVKFEKDLVGINYGTKTPAYIATGVREASKITLENLSAEDPSFISMPAPKNKAISPTLVSLSEAEEEAELERLNAAMLEEVAAMGSGNVILEERRAIPRDNNSGDNELFKSL